MITFNSILCHTQFTTLQQEVFSLTLSCVQLFLNSKTLHWKKLLLSQFTYKIWNNIFKKCVPVPFLENLSSLTKGFAKDLVSYLIPLLYFGVYLVSITSGFRNKTFCSDKSLYSKTYSTYSLFCFIKTRVNYCLSRYM